MPLLDVTDVLNDPDFATTFVLMRTSQAIGSNGRATDTASVPTATISGVVEPDKGRSMQRLADGSRITDAIKIYTTYGLTTGNGPMEADRINWNGGNYVVVTVRDWSQFGAGYYEVVADLTDINRGQ